jgi:hypothetical protein
MFTRLFGRRVSEPVSSTQPDPDVHGIDAAGGAGEAGAAPAHHRPTGPLLRQAQQERHVYPTHILQPLETRRNIFEEKYAIARSVEGMSPESVEHLDTCIAILTTGNWEAQQRNLDVVIRAMTGEQRRNLFRRIRATKRRISWAELYGDVNRSFEDICEKIMGALSEIGFSVERNDAEDVLAWVARERSGYSSRIQRAFRSHQPVKLRIVREIATATDNGLALGKQAREDAAVIFAAYHGVAYQGRDLLLRYVGTLDEPSLALLRIAGVEPGTFFERSRRNPESRAFTLGGFRSPADECTKPWHAFLEVYTAAQDLIADIDAHYASIQPQRTWLTDSVLFEEMFGPNNDDSDRNKKFRFGWWNESTVGKSGFPSWADYGAFQAVRRPDRNLSTREDLERLHNYIRKDDISPHVFCGRGIPDVEAWTFGGADRDGALLNHAVSIDASRPTRAWLKAAEEEIGRIGQEAVSTGLSRWAGHVLSSDGGAIDFAMEAEAAWLWRGVRWVAEEVERDKGGFGRATMIRRSAFEMVHALSYPLQINRVSEMAENRFKGDLERVLARPFSPINVQVMRSAVWMLALVHDDRAVPLLERLGRAFFVKRGGVFRSKIAGNAVLWSLGQIGSLPAVHALARIRRSIRDKSIAIQIDRALEEAGRKHGVSLADMQDLSMADYGIGLDGMRVEMLGPHRVTLAVVSSKKAVLTTLDTSDPKAKLKRGITKAALATEGAADVAGELKEAVKDIALLLPEARHRLESSWRYARSWPGAGWRDRYLDNCLVATLTRRLIWRFERPDGSVFDGIPQADGSFLVEGGGRCAFDPTDATVRLWHPLDGTAETVAAWRETLAREQLRQPFMQAWRPNSVVTDAERATGTYSNRFAGHILHQPPLIAMLRKRGWTSSARILGYAESDDRPTEIRLPAFGVAARYWFAGIGDRVQNANADYGATNFEYVATDRLVFYPLDAKGEPETSPMRVEDVPAMALSEVMRDIDLVVGITSIGSDRFWADRGDGAPPPASAVPGAETYRWNFQTENRGTLLGMRRSFLEVIVPSLKIGPQCHVEGDWLIVDGRLNSYKIHLGSGNSAFAKNGRYLCIVGARDDTEEMPFVPFEGDAVLSMVLSKAFLLAEDDKITEPVIVGQFRDFSRAAQ